jgi:hypothetical protein
MVILWAVKFYLLAVVLSPPDMSEGEDYGQVFEENRPWFLGLFITSDLTDIALTVLRGDLLDPPFQRGYRASCDDQLWPLQVPTSRSLFLPGGVRRTPGRDPDLDAGRR